MKKCFYIFCIFWGCQTNKSCPNIEFNSNIYHNFTYIELPREVGDALVEMTGIARYLQTSLLNQAEQNLPIRDAPNYHNWMLSDSLVQNSICRRWPIDARVQQTKIQLNLEFKGEATQDTNQIVIAIRRLSPPQDSAFFSIGYRVQKKNSEKK